MAEQNTILTVDGNGHALGEDVTIGALKSGNLSKLVELEVLGRDTLGRLGVDNLKVEVVGLSDCANGSAAGVTLCDTMSASYLAQDFIFTAARNNTSEQRNALFACFNSIFFSLGKAPGQHTG